MSNMTSHSNGASDSETPPSLSTGRNASVGESISESKSISEGEREFVHAMRELNDALTGLSESLQSLATVAAGDVDATEDVEATEELSSPKGSPFPKGASSPTDASRQKQQPTRSAGYEAAGAPFGSASQARGLWRLFRQQTTRN